MRVGVCLSTRAVGAGSETDGAGLITEGCVLAGALLAVMLRMPVPLLTLERVVMLLTGWLRGVSRH